MIPRSLKIAFLLSVFGAIIICLICGLVTFVSVPPIPDKIFGFDRSLLADKAAIMRGQANFQRYGLMDLGSVWGHGTYRGPDFTAVTLHKYGEEISKYLKANSLPSDTSRIASEIKTNNYDESSDSIVLTTAETYAYKAVIDYWDKVFLKGEPEANIRAGVIKSRSDRRALGTFFFWTAWCAGTLRPGTDHTYTNNWPPDRSVGNDLSADAAVWTVVSIAAFMIFLSAMIALYHWYGFYGKPHEGVDANLGKVLSESAVTKSQVKSAKYFLVVVVLFGLQTIMGGLMAHYTVHPSQFYGFDAVKDVFPYNWAKTWHLQLAVFWIAISWIGATIYLAPIIGGREPRKQSLLVDLLFVAAFIVIVGDLIGVTMGSHGLAGKHWFWIGHQGWEYLELGRLWQMLLMVGLILWLFIVVRAVSPVFRSSKDRWGLGHLLIYAGIAVVGFFAFGLFYNPATHITIADFWRWWVVHTWVEGAFEFFAGAAIALVTVALGLISVRDALRTAYFVAALALATGIIGVGHHYYWFGDPSLWFALGGVISALEPVPVLLLLAKAWQEYRAISRTETNYPYKWPLMFITSSAVWACIGAGVFGFLITTPIVNYYEHSTYLTVNHAHTALFGTYGMLAIGLLLFVLRGITRPNGFKERVFKIAWYGTNIGLFLMAFGTLFPVGIAQFLDSYKFGLWHARSPEFYSSPMIKFFGQIRIVPDSIIILLGVLPLVIGTIYALFNLKKSVDDIEALPKTAAFHE